MVVFQNLLPVLKIYNTHDVNYRFLALAVNFGTQTLYNFSPASQFASRCFQEMTHFQEAAHILEI